MVLETTSVTRTKPRAYSGMNARTIVAPLCLTLLTAACERSVSGPGTTASVEPALTRVEQRDQVCMVNDQFMGRSQIPVEVNRRTYFGCCAMCKARLEQERAARIAMDPLSGHEVDKSMAILAQDSAGKIVYFESDANLAAYLIKKQ